MKADSIFSQRVLKTQDSLKNKVYAFGRFRFDAEKRLLLEDGRSAPLPPKALALLALLIENRGSVAERQTLMQALWPGTFVEEGNLSQHVWTLRKVLGDDAIETVPRRGYRFIPEVEEVSKPGAARNRCWILAATLGAVLLALAAGLLFQSRAQASRRRQAEAYELCLKGRSCMLDKRSPDGVKRATGYFEQAKAIDPNCALAWAGLADIYSAGVWSGVRLPYREAMRKARLAAERALQLDPQLTEAHRASAEVKFRYEWDWPGADREFQAALRLNPRDSRVHESYAILLAVLGRARESVDQMNEAQRLEPLSPFLRLAAGWTLNLLRRPDQAIEAYNKALELDPGYARAHQYMSQAYLAMGMDDEAVAEEVKGSPTPEKASALRAAYAANGIRGFRQAWSKADAGAVTQARFAAWMGQADECMRWLEKAYEERDPQMPLIAAYRDFDAMRGDSRYVALVGRMRLSTPTALASGR